jgi:hypothetical protein
MYEKTSQEQPLCCEFTTGVSSLDGVRLLSSQKVEGKVGEKVFEG